MAQEENTDFTIVCWATVRDEQVVMMHRVHESFMTKLLQFIEDETRPGLVDETQVGQIIECTCTYLDAIRDIKNDYREFAQRNGWALSDLDAEFSSANWNNDNNFKGTVLHRVGEIVESIAEVNKSYSGDDVASNRRIFATRVRDLYIIDNFACNFDVISSNALRRDLGLSE